MDTQQVNTVRFSNDEKSVSKGVHRKAQLDIESQIERQSRWNRDIITNREIKMKWNEMEWSMTETKCLTRNNSLNVRLRQSHASYSADIIAN